MKQALLSLAAVFGIFAQSLATTYTVTVSDFEFSPSSLTVHPGDQITWVWVSGVHTTTSTVIPGGAPAWDTAITTASPTFTYDVPEMLGTYSYKCTPHESMGMVGTFTVIDATSVPSVSGSSFNMFPNPASGVAHVQFAQANSPATVNVFDITGRAVFSAGYTQAAQADIDTRAFGAGIYIVSVQQAGAMCRRELIVQ